jgi:hypothetical protein
LLLLGVTSVDRAAAPTISDMYSYIWTIRASVMAITNMSFDRGTYALPRSEYATNSPGASKGWVLSIT